jgi:hypothetical protein
MAKVTAPVKNINTPVNNATDTKTENNGTDAKQEVKTDTPAPEPESETLVKLRADKKVAYDAMIAAEFDTKPWLDAQMEMYKIGKLIEAEIANIAKQKQQAELVEKRNARIQLLTNLEDLLKEQFTFESTQHDSTDQAYIAQSNEINDRVKAAREIVQNELLARFATSTPSKSVATGETKPTGQKGATGERIRAAFIANRAAGMTDTDNVKAIIASGESRGTTGAVVLAYQREIGEKE